MANFLYTLNDIDRVCCVGAGRVGVLSMLVLAHHWPDKQFCVVDHNPQLIARWNNVALPPPIFEPHLANLLALHRHVNLWFRVEVEEEIDIARMIVIAVDVPLVVRGGPRMKNNLNTSNCMKVLNMIYTLALQQGIPKYVVEKSTMPVQLGHEIDQFLHTCYNAGLLQIVSNPEFFPGGNAIPYLMDPPKVVIASKFNADLTLLRDFYLPVVGGNIDRIVLVDSYQSATLAKLISNALLACNLTVMNATSSLCERIRANFGIVNNILTNGFIDSSTGYGGLGLTKDLAYVAYIAEFVGLKVEAQFFRYILRLNKEKKDQFLETVQHTMASALRGKAVAIFGFSNKVGTDDIRESPAIYICKKLLEQQVHIRIYDPVVEPQQILQLFPPLATLNVAGTMQAAWQGAHALIFLVRWPEFVQEILGNIQLIDQQMVQRPRFIFDGCDLSSSVPFMNQMHQLGFVVYRLGMSSL